MRCQLSSTEVGGRRDKLDWRPASVELSWRYLRKSTFNQRPWPVYHTERPVLSTARYPWGSASRGSICDGWYFLLTSQDVIGRRLGAVRCASARQRANRPGAPVYLATPWRTPRAVWPTPGLYLECFWSTTTPAGCMPSTCRRWVEMTTSPDSAADSPSCCTEPTAASTPSVYLPTHAGWRTGSENAQHIHLVSYLLSRCFFTV